MNPNTCTAADTDALTATEQAACDRLDAAQLLRAAADFGTRFGSRVFLGSIPGVDLSDPECVALLERCRLAGQLRFGRADLVAAMDPELVAASLWECPAGVPYHFMHLAAGA